MRKVLISALVAICFAGCAATGTPNQQAINAATTSYKGLDTAINAADAAVKANTLKGKDAINAAKGLTDAKAALDVALTALRSANAVAIAASGVTK